ncbi:epoxide hydrolase [Pacificimonas flava]|uniref:Epoxide hydrolase n=2 Tax=Pacificimonas TaxID=1960290 RepID=A0A219B8X1_9SPHN|nr:MULTISPECIES: alpha/beta hydrolase [Pacificimonas]OWV34787.1 epoxide hydrolase [Pacificimonas flava]
MTEFGYVETGRATLHYASEGEGPLVLFVHGFPEGWYSWRHQLPAVAAAGYRAVAVDVRGYGGSTKRHAISEYSLQELAADMAGAAAALSERPAVIVGHDWGAPISWTSALLHPQQFRAIACLSVPHSAPGEIPTDEVHDKIFTQRGRYFYQVDFQDEGRAEAELEADPAETIRKFYYALSGDAPDGTWPTDKKPGDGLLKGLIEPPIPLLWLTQEDVAHYAFEFGRSGFRGPLNRYRNRRRDWNMLRSRNSHVIAQPSLFISGTRDLATRLAGSDGLDRMKDLLPGLMGIHMLEGAGHWTQQEKPHEVNSLLVDWLAQLDG